VKTIVVAKIVKMYDSTIFFVISRSKATRNRLDSLITNNKSVARKQGERISPLFGRRDDKKERSSR
ncbi:MAG: hypothetical protein V1891_02730, partial [bacterium]